MTTMREPEPVPCHYCGEPTWPDQEFCSSSCEAAWDEEDAKWTS